MHIASKTDVQQPLHSPWGEIVHELVGAAEQAGGAQKHSLALVTIPPGKASQLHYHHTAEETYYVLRGTARLVIDGQESQLLPGQACLIQPPEQHQIFNSGQDDLEFIAVCTPPWTPEDSVEIPPASGE
jgi:mannose-6-phosphate isomerase-like protein (cupin superfamily)